MWLMDDVTKCNIRAQDIRIWRINSQNFRARKIWKTWFIDMGAFSWQNATYTIQFILTIYINSEKLMLPGRRAPVEFFSWKCGKSRKTAKRAYPALIWPFRTSLFSALSWNKISYMKLQSLKMFKKTKDIFYNLNFLRIYRADYGAPWTLSITIIKFLCCGSVSVGCSSTHLQSVHTCLPGTTKPTHCMHFITWKKVSK